MKIISVKEISKNLSLIKRSLQNGGLIVYPTETAYGIGAMATNPFGVSKLLDYKKRPTGKAVSIAVSSIAMAKLYVNLNQEALKLYEQFLPGPLTIVSKSKNVVDKRLESDTETLGIRIPDFPATLKLINALGFPITATSANSAGKKTPYSVQDVLKNISKKQTELIDLIIDAGELPKRKASTVVDTTNNAMQIIRKGDVLIKSTFLEKTVNSTKEMINLGSKVYAKLQKLYPKSIIVLLFNAEMGAGKTHFTKGIGKAMGIKETIVSPTYNLLNEYCMQKNGKTICLIHIDAWRMNSISELIALELHKYLLPNNIIAVEWSGMTNKHFLDLKTKFSKSNMQIFTVEISYKSETSRDVRIY